MENDHDDEARVAGDRQFEEGADRPEEPLFNAQEVLDECISNFATTDYIMEPGIYTNAIRFIRAGGGPELAIDLLSANYMAFAQMVNIMAEWLMVAGMQNADVQAIIENNAKIMVLKTFDPQKADMMFNDGDSLRCWLKEVCEHFSCRSLIYQLAEQYPACLMLKRAIQFISDSGFEGEIKAISIAAQHLGVFSRILKASIAEFLSQRENWQSALEECAKVVCYGQHTFVYGQVLLQMLSRKSKGGFIMKRLSQEITKHALKSQRNVTPITMALNGSSRYAEVCASLSFVLSRNALNTADILVLFRHYSSSQPPPVEFIRNPQFLDLLVGALFKVGVSTEEEHKSKYLYLLGYAASVVEKPRKKGVIRIANREELNDTICAIEKAHSICNASHSSTELLRHIKTLFSCIRFPVVAVGVIRWVQDTVTEPSYFKICTESYSLHLALLDEVAVEHAPLLHDQILRLLIHLFESQQDELEILEQLEIRKMLLDRMVHLMANGCVVPVVQYIGRCCSQRNTDVSLIRYFVAEVLDMVSPEYSTEFVQLFLPIVENEEITGSMRDKNGNDPASEFILHCKALN
ncbi:hypothetical protein ZHAS_00016024 [Anopheles sinensis]|uniref:Negative elongation factor D n=1 Tax=Anopheles sinensis TaxID=74873 RepID=A0A084WCL3_ANOSI|nr:hypothetical protein ZHAS_00016024 [Anopheles sinensis]